MYKLSISDYFTYFSAESDGLHSPGTKAIMNMPNYKELMLVYQLDLMFLWMEQFLQVHFPLFMHIGTGHDVQLKLICLLCFYHDNYVMFTCVLVSILSSIFFRRIWIIKLCSICLLFNNCYHGCF